MELSTKISSRVALILPLFALSAFCVLTPCSSLAENRSERILESILRAIETDPALGPREMTVEVGRGGSLLLGEREGELGRGVVRLQGVVSSESDRIRVNDIARNTAGVTGVHDQLQVGDVYAIQANAQEFRNRLAAESLQSGYTLLARLSPSTLTVTGHVGSEADARTIERVAHEVAGNRKVEMHLTRSSVVSDGELERRVRQALSELHQVDATRVAVQASDGVVTLSGDAANHREVDSILSEALMIPGVRDVESDVTVQGRRYPLDFGSMGRG